MRPVIENAIGTKDGVNTLFQTTVDYRPGTLFVFRNGQLQQKDFVTELSGRQFRVADPPISDEDLQVRYLSID